ncbi:Rpn family recombination-promoting nuclease/putative transposase [Trichothermofontia sichuanensis B231]|uniref:Rpn family recombination-promoting nuclease/putative transposase n=1 Tax=Trichothermofontia sichuanensis TaxID=3045816 RepID=UPI0022463FBA|nr:Rpn family recombination-promoting nuclease/putative transposase [Trichothermofontia sichuanensis]UZQ54820.1 Rpn family recombination-promoting nuclease/putative transposase [Trichothermofontia sichuanensis B231]
MSFDNLCKLIAEKHPDRIAAWILGEAPQSVSLLKTELSIEPLRADSVVFLRTHNRILHLEFQTRLESDPPLPLRMLDYWVRLYRRYRVPITQVVVLLLPPAPGTVIETCFALEGTIHPYQVLCLWEQDPQPLLADPVLLPFAVLVNRPNPEQWLAEIAQRVRQLESEPERQQVCAYVQLLAGLKFKPGLICQVFQEGIMRESVIYQEIFQEGERKGRQEGELKGRQQGRQEGRQEEAAALILRILTHRFGDVPATVQTRVRQLTVEQLEALVDAALTTPALSALVLPNEPPT